MKIEKILRFGFVNSLVLCFVIAFSQNSFATPHYPNQFKSYKNYYPLQVARARVCRKRMGPYATQRRAWQLVRRYRSRGFRTSNVWGSGGMYYSTRGYYFNVFYRC